MPQPADKAPTEGLRLRPGDQPLPTEGEENVQAALIAHIEKRKALGLKRYGRPVQTFNGRDATQDLMDELLDGATYAMQVKMEREATQDRINRALAKHHADWEGNCTSCRVASPCETRQILTSQTKPAEKPRELTFSTIHPVEQVAVHSGSLGDLKAHLKLNGFKERLGASLGAYFGLPIVTDDRLEPGHVRMRPQGFDDHPSSRYFRQ